MTEWIKLGADYKREVKGLKALGKYKLRIELNYPYPAFLHTLTMPFTSVVPFEAVETYKNLKTTAVGSGPYIIESKNKRKFQLTKNLTSEKKNLFSKNKVLKGL